MILAFIYRTTQVIQRQIAEMVNTDRQLRKEKKKSDTVLYQVGRSRTKFAGRENIPSKCQ